MVWVRVVSYSDGSYADLDWAGFRFLRCSPCECLEERCNRFDALVCSSTLVSRLTRFQVSREDSSPSSPHLSDESSVGDMDGGSGALNIRGWKPQKSPLRQNFHWRNPEDWLLVIPIGRDWYSQRHDLLAVLEKDRHLFSLETVDLSICHAFNLLVIFQNLAFVIF